MKIRQLLTAIALQVIAVIVVAQEAPVADTQQIEWTIEGAKQISIEANGNLLIETALGTIFEQAPIAFQGQQTVEAHWRIGGNKIGFDLGTYTANLSLTIDPIVRIWGTRYDGIEFDAIVNIVSDNSSNIYVVGNTWSSTSIATSRAHQTPPGGNHDAFLVKFTSTGVRQ